MTKLRQNSVSSEDEFKASPSRMRDFLSFLKTIRAFKGDLASLTAPPFLLSDVSIIEYTSQWTEQPAVFTAPAQEPDPAKRALLVLTWFLTTLRQQFGRRDGRKKKPLNPILGELFLGSFADAAVGPTQLVAEQVSHHPPVTAYHVWNDDAGVRLSGYHRQKTYFSGTLHIERPGYVLLHLDTYDEDYLITIPSMHLEGFLPPPPRPEIGGHSRIQSSSGFTAEIDYSGKGWLRGKPNSFAARLSRTSDAQVLYRVDGQWQGGSFTIKDCGSGSDSTSSTATPTVVDTTTAQLTPLSVAPLSQQDALESRRVWWPVAAAIEAGEMSQAGREKSKLEEAQRAARKTELIEGTTWPTRYFERVKAWPQLEALAKAMGDGGVVHGLGPEDGGMWRWSEEKYRKTLPVDKEAPKPNELNGTA